MLFIDIDGLVAKARRFVSGSGSVQEDEVKNPAKLAEILRGTLRRLSDVEATVTSEGVEFEVEVSTAGATVSLAHNLKSDVRWYVVFWTKVRAGTAYPVAGPDLIADETSDKNTLVLRSYTAGRAIVRIEPAFKGVAYNVS